MIAVVLNPSSGQTRREGLRSEIERLCGEAGVKPSICETADPAQLAVVAREALAAHPEAIVAAGGDGTVSSIAALVAGTAVPLGVLPLGTLNHFAKDLGIPLDLRNAIDTIAARHTRRVDVGRVNGLVFINNSSLGVYPSIVEARERLRNEGRSKWTALAMATFEVLRRDDELSIRLEADRTKILARTPFVFVGNNEYLAEGIRLGGRTTLEGRRLHAYFAPPVRTRHLPNLFAHALFGIARREHVLTSIASTELWIDTPLAPRMTVACDGELHVFDTPLHYRSWPAALNVITPANGH